MERHQDDALYVISVAADLAGVHPQTLRLYERKGLLDPARSAGGNRRYSERDLARLRRIGDLTAAGVNLEGVRRILDLEHDNEELRAELDRTRAEAAAAVEAAPRQYRRQLVPDRAVPWHRWHDAVINEGTAGSDGDGAARRVYQRR
jgi:MerR family transcriptional regulator/heat shock protein HspR